jgi:tRNA pseudouridine(55) synthase
MGYNRFMENMVIICKNLGETPLSALERTRTEKGIPDDVPMTYAGRLDPLAEGQMIILVGEECKNKEAYTGLSKSYEFEILAGVSTDSYDLLGLVTEVSFSKNFLDIEKVKEYLEDNKKTFIQNYPPYSSKTFLGKQLHTHAREGNTPHVEHEVTLHNFEFLGEREINSEELLKAIEERINLVHGDFRQEEIKKKWSEILEPEKAGSFHVTRWRVDVSSGFYIRQLVHDIGATLGIPTATFHIKRTKIGDLTS